VVVASSEIPTVLVNAKFAELGHKMTFTGYELYAPAPISASLLPFGAGTAINIDNGPGGIMAHLDHTALNLTVTQFPNNEVCTTPPLPGGWYMHVGCSGRFSIPNTNTISWQWPVLHNWNGTEDYADPVVEYDRGTNAYVVELCCYGGFGVNGDNANVLVGIDLTYEAFIAISDGVVDSMKLSLPKVSNIVRFSFDSFEITLIPPEAAFSYRKRLEDLGTRKGMTLIKAAQKVHECKDPARGYVRL
jgi:hypothetical protein